MPDEPRFLAGDGAGAPEAETPAAPEPRLPEEPGDSSPQTEPTPEQRAAIEAVLAGRIEEIAPRKCIACDSRDCVPVYVLLNHSSFEIGRRYQIFGSISIQRSTLAPCVMPMCAACFAHATTNRRRQRLGAYLGIAGLVLGMGYFVAALAMAPTVIAVSLLFGGGALLAAAMINAVVSQKLLNQYLRLPRLPGMAVLVLSTERSELEHMLERYKLGSLELQSQIDRKASEASALPEARLHSK